MAASTPSTTTVTLASSKKLPQYLAASAVNIASMTIGISLAWPSPSITKLLNIDETPLNYTTSDEQNSWIGSLFTAGAIFGPLPAGLGSDIIGRKITLLLAAVPFIVAYFVISTTSNIIQIYASRFFMGIGLGAFFTTLPIYVGEITEDSIRGACGSFLQIFLSFGLVLAYGTGPFISFSWLAVECLIIPVIFIIVFSFIPESPTFLLTKNRLEEASVALGRLRGLEGESLKNELSIIKTTVDKAMKSKQTTFKDIIQNKGNCKALFLALGLITGQQLSGINVVLFYTERIFEATGSVNLPAHISAIIIGAVQVVSSCLTPFVVERLGRRVLLLISAIGMCISLFVLGLYFLLNDSGINITVASPVSKLSLILYVMFFCIGFGPLPWAVIAEIFPANVRSKAAIMIASFCWFICFLMTKFFTNVIDLIGMAGAFWIFSGFGLLSAIFVFMCLPETKGKSIQQIQDELNGIKIK